MRAKSVSMALVLAAIGALALGGFASAKKPAKTTVTIEAQVGGFFGFVKSSKPNKCANNRVVSLYKQRGSHPDPSHDTKIGTDPAQPNGDGYMWSINAGSSGRFYARVKAKQGCKGDISPTVQAEV